MSGSDLPPVPPGRNGPPPVRRGRKDYTPVKWDEYFSSQHEVAVEGGDVFMVYKCQSPNYTSEKPVLILLHGAGYSGLTWSCFAAEIISMVQCSVIAVDLRGHGESHAQNEHNLSAETMARDVGHICDALYEDQELKPPAILIGHRWIYFVLVKHRTLWNSISTGSSVQAMVSFSPIDRCLEFISPESDVYPTL